MYDHSIMVDIKRCLNPLDHAVNNSKCLMMFLCHGLNRLFTFGCSNDVAQLTENVK